MLKIEKFKRKKVGNQERGSSLTLEQLKQNTNVKFEEIYDYLDKIQHASLDEGGTISGNLDIKGNVTKSGQQIVTHNTDKSIISDGTFNKGSWNKPTEGAITQIIDNSGAQHSAVVGLGKDGNRHYGIDLYDSYDSPEMRLYAGNHNLHLGLDGRIEYDGKIIPTIESGTWTPALCCRDTNNIWQYQPSADIWIRYGNYIRIHNLVYIDFYIRGKITALNGSYNYAVIGGIPFNINENNTYFGQEALSIGVLFGATSWQGNATFTLQPGINCISLQGSDGANALSWQVTPSDYPYFEIGANGWYRCV